MHAINREEIIRLTEEYGGQWGINHTRRLLERRRATLPLVIHLEKAKAIAAKHIQRMDAVLAAFKDETLGHF
jgi:hypothetical protein